VIGIVGEQHDVANFYKGIFFLSVPLTIEFCERIQNREKEENKGIANKANVLWLIMSGFSSVISLTLLLIQNNDLPLIAEHVWSNEYWESSLAMLPFFIVPYIISNFYSPIKDYIKTRQLHFEERENPSG